MPDRYCRECGTELTPGDHFCSSCGTELDTSTGSTQSNTGTQPQQGSESQFDEYYDDTPSGGATQTTQQKTESQSVEYGSWDESTQSGRNPQSSTYQNTRKDTDMGAISHVAGLFAGIIGAILIYAIADDSFAKENAANATNWHIMLMIYSFSSFFLIFVHPIFFLAVFGLMFANFGFAVIAAIKASNGEAWQYPLTPNILSSPSNQTPSTNNQGW